MRCSAGSPRGSGSINTATAITDDGDVVVVVVVVGTLAELNKIAIPLLLLSLAN